MGGNKSPFLSNARSHEGTDDKLLYKGKTPTVKKEKILLKPFVRENMMSIVPNSLEEDL